MSGRVVDTNVLVAANGKDTHADSDCRVVCVEALLETVELETLRLDEAGEILDEYATYCSFSGQPGVGDEFFRWAFQNQGRLVRHDLAGDETLGYADFPADDRLAGFDPSDRKFVALVRADGDAVLLNALDSDYAEVNDVLDEVGVSVVEFCAHQLPRE